MGPIELILILVVVVLLFGAKKIPEIAKGLGQGIKEFKTTTKEPINPDTTVVVTPRRDSDV
ncbi:twin-arginine translocase TatA/TatE family subunit [Deinococcus irradiatisoli]|uniref:Sec-independent protein translocase protein TatA n=1 Tax=Deinococcus irradiatisoli TaxID=2202254 RepID=A0A2Z3JFE7_9DEIO|nr:twin-arginine translocase TatA/TatE family subunit [Deinococcus irradiatisoli]AWN23762.1 twin-arginine translocase TatA/TatE family subunit [Deinococcus irradiatisoli]